MKQTPRFYAKLILIIIGLFIVTSALSFKADVGSRRDIRTLSDTGATNIYFTTKRYEVSEIFALFSPTVQIKKHRFGAEYNTYQTNCIIKKYTKAENGDYQLLLQGDEDSLYISAEILNPDNEDLKGNPHLPEYVRTRQEFEKYIDTTRQKARSGYYKIIGVCFFDKSGAGLKPILFINKFK